MTTIILDRAEAYEALALACRLIPRRQNIPVLACARIDAAPDSVTLTATDLDATIRIVLPSARADGTASVILDGHPFRDLLKSSTAASLTIEPGATHAAITMGGASLTIPTHDASKWPDASIALIAGHDVTAAFQAPRRVWADALDSVAFAISTEETRYYLNGIYLHTYCGNIRMVTTDGHQMACHDLPVCDDSEWSVIVPRGAVSLMGHAFKAPKAKKGAPEAPTVSVKIHGHKGISVESGHVTVTTKPVDGSFPDYGRVIPTWGDGATFSAGAMAAAVKALRAVWATDRKFVGSVVWHFEPGQIVVSAAREGKKAEVAIPCEHQCGTLQIAFNAHYVTDVLANFDPSDDVTALMGDPGSPGVFQRSDGTRYVLMPMRADTSRKPRAPEPEAAPAPIEPQSAPAIAPVVADAEPEPIAEPVEAQTAPVAADHAPKPDKAPTRHASEPEAPAMREDAPELARYLATMPPLARGKARAALERVQGFSGAYMPRHVWAERRADTVQIDHDKGRVMLGETFYAFADVTGAVVAYVAWIKANRATRKPADDVPDLPNDPRPCEASIPAPMSGGMKRGAQDVRKIAARQMVPPRKRLPDRPARLRARRIPYPLAPAICNTAAPMPGNPAAYGRSGARRACRRSLMPAPPLPVMIWRGAGHSRAANQPGTARGAPHAGRWPDGVKGQPEQRTRRGGTMAGASVIGTGMRWRGPPLGPVSSLGAATRMGRAITSAYPPVEPLRMACLASAGEGRQELSRTTGPPTPRSSLLPLVEPVSIARGATHAPYRNHGARDRLARDRRCRHAQA